MKASDVLASNPNGLNDLKMAAKKDQKSALPEVARQFEAIFMQSMLKSMRKAGEIFSDSNIFKSNDEEMFQDMMDQQLSIKLANSRGVGLAEVLIRQLEKTLPAGEEASITDNNVTTGKNLPVVTKKANETQDGVFQSAKEFITELWPHAKKAAKAIGLDPKLLIAQSALETGWGKYIIGDKNGESSNNLFNIKASSPQHGSVSVKTKEFLGGEFRDVQASFKKYQSFEHSFNDYIQLLSSNSRYDSALKQSHDATKYIEALHEAGYATDPKYADKVLSIYEGGELTGVINELEVK